MLKKMTEKDILPTSKRLIGRRYGSSPNVFSVLNAEFDGSIPRSRRGSDHIPSTPHKWRPRTRSGSAIMPSPPNDECPPISRNGPAVLLGLPDSWQPISRSGSVDTHSSTNTWRRCGWQSESITSLRFGSRDSSPTTEMEKLQTMYCDTGRLEITEEKKLPIVPQRAAGTANFPVCKGGGSYSNLLDLSRKLDKMELNGSRPLRRHHVENVNNKFDEKCKSEHLIRWLSDHQLDC